MSAGRSPDQQVDPAGTVVSKVCTSLQIPDLDARFELKVRSMLSWCFPMMYDDFARSVDVAGLRGRGLASVVTAIDFRRERGPAAVGAPMSTRVETRHVELSGAGLGRQATRLGFESSFIFTTPVGSGDRLRYRETLTEQPRCAGHGRVLLTLVRPFGSRADLLVTEIQDELRHLGLHSLNEPHPTVESLSEVPADFVEAPSRTVENRGIFGLQHTDVNQFVYTADILRSCRTRSDCSSLSPASRWLSTASIGSLRSSRRRSPPVRALRCADACFARRTKRFPCSASTPSERTGQ